MRLGMAQISVKPGDPSGNLLRIAEAVEQLKGYGADWILLPECADTGWSHGPLEDLSGTIPGGAFYEGIRQCALRHHVGITCGMTRRSGQHFFNSAVSIDPHGNLLHVHDKIYELDFAQPLYAQGTGLRVFRTSAGMFGVMICADGFAGDLCLSRSLAYMGADLILCPSAWAVPPTYDNGNVPYGKLWVDSFAPVARKFGIHIAAVSNVGPIESGTWAGHSCIGCSMIVDPLGEVRFMAPFGSTAESLTVHNLPLAKRNVRGTGWDTSGNQGA